MLELSRVGKFMGSTDWDWESERFTLELCLFLLNSSEMKSCVAKTKTSNIRKRARDFRWLFVILNVEFIILSVITFLWMKSVFEKPRILCDVKNGTWSQATPLHSNNNAIRLKKKYRYLHWIRKQTFWSEFERKIELKGFEFKFGSLIHLKIYQHYQKPFEVVSTMYWSDWTGLDFAIQFITIVWFSSDKHCLLDGGGGGDYQKCTPSIVTLELCKLQWFSRYELFFSLSLSLSAALIGPMQIVYCKNGARWLC